jgi:hypothetical protein
MQSHGEDIILRDIPTDSKDEGEGSDSEIHLIPKWAQSDKLETL